MTPETIDRICDMKPSWMGWGTMRALTYAATVLAGVILAAPIALLILWVDVRDVLWVVCTIAASIALATQIGKYRRATRRERIRDIRWGITVAQHEATGSTFPGLHLNRTQRRAYNRTRNRTP